MVGVPGRSKGCGTCKKRRVKCDEEKPTCFRCRRGGFVCAGYARPLEIRLSHHVKVATPKPQEQPTFEAEQRVPVSLSLMAFRDDIHFAFLFDNFVWSSYGSPWLQFAAQGKLGHISRQACQALSQTTFGKHHYLRDTELTGATQYGLAVGGLRSALTPRQQRATPDAALLVPILIFLMHASTAASLTESTSHVMGMYMILQTCGPQAFQDPALRPAFSSCRATLVIVGLIQKKKLFLDSEDWRTVPWINMPESKSQQDHLTDILTFVPGYLELQQELHCMAIEKRQNLLASVSGKLVSLFDWRVQWARRNPIAAWEETRVTDTGEIQPSDNEKQLRFSSFALAVEIALYNAILLCLLGLLHTIAGAPRAHKIARHSTAPSAHLVPSPRDTILRLPHDQDYPATLLGPAKEIVRAFEFQLVNVGRSRDSALFWLFPLGLAGKVLEGDVLWTAWIRRMLDKSHVTRGYGKGENAFGFGFYEMPKVAEVYG